VELPQPPEERAVNAKGLVLFGAVTVAVLGAAVWAVRARENRAAVTLDPARSDKLFPGLRAKLGEVAAVRVQHGDASYTLERNESGWGLSEMGGYPVDEKRVERLLVTLAELEKLDPKTSKPDRYAELGVQDPAPEAESARVALAGSGGEELAALIVGKPREGRGPAAFYARKPGDAQSWLVDGRIDVKNEGKDWLEKEILRVERDRVRSVEIVHPDGETVVIAKDAPKDTDFAVRDVPAGKELKYPSIGNGVASALEWLSLEEVVPAGSVELGPSPTVAKFTTFDGLVVTATTAEKDGKVYARFEAAYDASARPADEASAPTEPSAEAGAATEAGQKPVEPPADGETAADAPESGAAATAADAKPKKTAEEVQAEVAKLTEKLSSWIYVIPDYNRSSFAKRMSDLVQEPEPPPPGETAGPPAESAGDAQEPPPSPPQDPPPPPAEDPPQPETPPQTPPSDPPK
jgi:hypothetical protein